MKSPFKKRTVPPHQLPRQSEFMEEIILSYGSKKRDRTQLNIVTFLKKHNKQNKKNNKWLLPLLTQSDEFKSLLACFFFGADLVEMFSKAIGRSNDSIPGFQFFEDILSNATTIHVEDAVMFKSRLIVAIESSYKDNNLKTQHPVIDLLSQTTKEVGHGGWLLQLHVKGKSEEERPRTDVFLATALYNIIGAGCIKRYYDTFAEALGSTAKLSHKKKDFITNITRPFIRKLSKEADSNTAPITVATTPTTTSTELSTTIDASSTVSSTIAQNKPLTIVTNANDNINMVLSPLTDSRNGTAVGFFQDNDMSPMATNMALKTPSKSPNIDSQFQSPVFSISTGDADDDQHNSFSIIGSPNTENREARPKRLDFSHPQRQKENIRKEHPSPAVSLTPPSFQPVERRRRKNGTTPSISLATTNMAGSTQSQRRAAINEINDINESNEINDINEINPASSSTAAAGGGSGLLYTSTINEIIWHLRRLLVENVDGHNLEMARETLMKILLETPTDKHHRVTEVVELMMTADETTTKKKVLDDIGGYLCKNYTQPDGSITLGRKGGSHKLIPLKNLRRLKGSQRREFHSRWRKDTCRAATKFVRTFLDGKDETEKSVLKKLIAKDLVDDEEKQDNKITALEALGIQAEAGYKIPNVALEKMIRSTVLILQKKGQLKNNDSSPFVGRLRAKMGKLEAEGAVPMKLDYIQLETTKDESARVVFYYIENVMLLLEKLLALSIADGTFRTSFLLSSLRNKILIKFGCDRGAGNLIMMIALVNRLGGNHGKYSIAIGNAEGAAETYDNLAKTVYSDDRKEVLEQLVNQHVYVIILKFIKDDGTGTTISKVKCISMRLDGISRDVLSTTNFPVQTEEYPQNNNEQITWKSDANNRSNADTVTVNSNMCVDNNNQNEIHLKIQLIKLKSSYVGCKVLSSKTNEEIFSFKFDNDVVLENIDDDGKIDASLTTGFCSQYVAFTSEDGKMCSTVNGVGTCGASFPCPQCLWGVKNKTVPSWLQDYLNEEEKAKMTFKDYDRRIADKSKKKSYADFSFHRGDRTDNVPIEVKRKFHSVVYKPLLHIDDEFLIIHNGGSLHVSQGIMTHLTQTMCDILDTIELDGEEEFTSTLITEIEDYLETIEDLKNSDKVKNAKVYYNKMSKEVREAWDLYEEAKENDNDENVEELYDAFKLYAEERNTEGMEENEFVRLQRIISGGEELKIALEKFKISKKKNMNKARFLFMKGLKTVAGDFNKSHGVHELTNARGITALEKRKIVYEIVLEGCNNNVDIIRAMDWWLECADYLLDISLILKTQRKLSLEEIDRLKRQTANYIKLWYPKVEEYSPRNPIFWKLHMLLCGIIPFAMKFHFIGLISEEGFENKHHTMRHISENMAPIATDVSRCEKMNQRQQHLFIPGMAEVTQIFSKAKEEAKRGKRGPYKNRGKKTKLLENLPLHDEDNKESIPDYFLSVKNNFIPNELKDVYVFIVYGKVPEDWAETFHHNINLGSKASYAAGYVPP
tara:strand:+ start:557 stop:5065 length:4509 start_codon:yes stop_codon:yes gene_type:complete